MNATTENTSTSTESTSTEVKKADTKKSKSTKPAKSKGSTKKSTKPAKSSKSTKPSKPAVKKSKAAAGNGRAFVPPADYAKAEEYARKVSKEYGPVTVIRAVTQKFAKLERKDVLHIADKLGISLGTASHQYQSSRSGEIELDLNALLK